MNLRRLDRSLLLSLSLPLARPLRLRAPPDQDERPRERSRDVGARERRHRAKRVSSVRLRGRRRLGSRACVRRLELREVPEGAVPVRLGVREDRG